MWERIGCRWSRAFLCHQEGEQALVNSELRLKIKNNFLFHLYHRPCDGGARLITYYLPVFYLLRIQQYPVNTTYNNSTGNRKNTKLFPLFDGEWYPRFENSFLLSFPSILGGNRSLACPLQKEIIFHHFKVKFNRCPNFKQVRQDFE